jgi:putative hydrolase of the HAD superfamily
MNLFSVLFQEKFTVCDTLVSLYLKFLQSAHSASEDHQMTTTTLFLDIGGVLLTNGWGRQVRRDAAEKFGIDYAEMDERHHLSFNTYEDGKLTLEQYLDQVVFYTPRPFSRNDFKTFMYAQSQPFPDMIEFMTALKAKYQLKLVVVSNEGRELTAYRIERFALRSFIDAFVVSSHVHYRKPDRDIYLLALDIAHAQPSEVIYIDDRPLFIEVASTLNIPSVQHKTVSETAAALAVYNLAL